MRTTLMLVGILPGLLLASPSSGENPSGDSRARVSLVYFGSPVVLEENDIGIIEREIDQFFDACHTHAAVTGAAQPQEELEELWRHQGKRGYVLLESRGGTDNPHLHLRDRDYVLMLGLEAGQGVWPTLTRHDGELTSYIKCPGLEAISLSCTLHAHVPGVELWQDCDP